MIGTNRQVCVFDFLSGKMKRIYDESISMYQEAQKEEDSIYKTELIDFGRRVAMEKEVNRNSLLTPSNAVFDESGKFLVYASLMGVKVVNLFTNKLSRLLGRNENVRFTQIALFQGKTEGSFYRGDHQKEAREDATLFCCAFNQKRFYLFTRREPNLGEEEDESLVGRDVFNEKPSKDEQHSSSSSLHQQQQLQANSTVILHTSKGDITLQLFPTEAPKAVTNFLTHSRNGYYNGHIFHRVIRGFMIQSGDPLGDGTGGESIWNSDFEDEFSPNLHHDKPGVLSMANSNQPNSNGSQWCPFLLFSFYPFNFLNFSFLLVITTVAIPKLDNKHTIFGQVVKGMEVVFSIEQTPTDHNDKPREDIKIISITLQ